MYGRDNPFLDPAILQTNAVPYIQQAFQYIQIDYTLATPCITKSFPNPRQSSRRTELPRTQTPSNGPSLPKRTQKTDPRQAATQDPTETTRGTRRQGRTLPTTALRPTTLQGTKARTAEANLPLKETPRSTENGKGRQPENQNAD